jgi:hypothetical protein
MIPPNGILKGAIFRLTVHPASQTELDQETLQQLSSEYLLAGYLFEVGLRQVYLNAAPCWTQKIAFGAKVVYLLDWFKQNASFNKHA